MDSMVNRSVQAFQEFYTKIISLWDEMGIEEQVREDRNSVITHHAATLLERMYEEECQNRDQLRDKVEELAVELINITEDLDMLPFEPPDNSSLLELEKFFMIHLDEMKVEKEERCGKLNKLKVKEIELCKYLGLPEHKIHRTTPNDNDLKEVEANIKYMAEEKKARLKKFSDLRMEITELFYKLDEVPEEAFERSVFYAEMDHLKLTRENLTATEDILSRIKERYEKNSQAAEKLREQIKDLWSKLEVDENYRACFLGDNKGCSTVTIIDLKKELEAMKIKKKANIEKFILKLKKELDECYNKCHYGTRQRKYDFDEDELSEESLTTFENKIQDMKVYFAKHEQLFKKINKWLEHFQKMTEFSSILNTPARLNNRGGTLLQEEKERKRINKFLPQVETEINNMINEMKKQGKEFIIYDVPVVDYLASKWSHYHQEKENEKVERAKSVKAAELTPLKRKRDQTPSKLTPFKQNTVSLKKQGSAIATSASKRLKVPLTPGTSAIHNSPLLKSRTTPRLKSRKSLRLNSSRRKVNRPGIFNESIQKFPKFDLKLRPSDVSYTKFSTGLKTSDLHSTFSSESSSNSKETNGKFTTPSQNKLPNLI